MSQISNKYENVFAFSTISQNRCSFVSSTRLSHTVNAMAVYGSAACIALTSVKIFWPPHS